MTPDELGVVPIVNLLGHTHYLIIDDVDQIPDSPAMSGPYVGQRPWTSLIPQLSQAADV